MPCITILIKLLSVSSGSPISLTLFGSIRGFLCNVGTSGLTLSMLEYSLTVATVVEDTGVVDVDVVVVVVVVELLFIVDMVRMFVGFGDTVVVVDVVVNGLVDVVG